MLSYDKHNPPTASTQFSALHDEFMEVCDAIREQNWKEVWDELNDCVHTSLRFVVILFNYIPLIGPYIKVVLIVLLIIGYKTAKNMLCDI